MARTTLRAATTAATIAIAISGCTTTTRSTTTTIPAGSQSQSRVVAQLSSREVQLVEEGVRARLKDPQSAIFGPVMATTSGPPTYLAVCGTVNARNGFGGYGGSELFYGTLLRTKDGRSDFALQSIGDYVAAHMTETFCLPAVRGRS